MLCWYYCCPPPQRWSPTLFLWFYRPVCFHVNPNLENLATTCSSVGDWGVLSWGLSEHLNSQTPGTGWGPSALQHAAHQQGNVLTLNWMYRDVTWGMLTLRWGCHWRSFVGLGGLVLIEVSPLPCLNLHCDYTKTITNTAANLSGNGILWSPH